MMDDDVFPKEQPTIELPERLISKSGYEFDPSSERWKLDKEVTISLTHTKKLSAGVNLGFRLALARYAEELSAKHASNMAFAFYRYLRATGAMEVTSTSLINWRAQLDEKNEWFLGALRGFLLAWHGWGFPGITDDVVSLLEGWTIKGNEKGRAVSQGDLYSGPYTDLEITAILAWANQALTNRDIGLEAYAYLLTLLMTARRPVQITALRGADLLMSNAHGVPSYSIRIPRAKQRSAGFRENFRALPIIEDLYLTLVAQHRASVRKVEEAFGFVIPGDLQKQIPVFVNETVLKQSSEDICDLNRLRDILMGSTQDRLHAPTFQLKKCLEQCEAKCSAKSERTGRRIHLMASRFRYTRGTNLRRQGFGATIIAELLDHSDVQNVKVYTENTVQEAEIINRLVGSQLAPFAQACMGTLVSSEREAIRGDDPRSRVPNHKQDAVGTCGNYGFCASGYRACYTCHHFQPWIDGPHNEVLDELYREKQRAKEAGCAREVVNANDRLILAVEHCVALCNDAKASRDSCDQTRSLSSVVNDG